MNSEMSAPLSASATNPVYLLVLRNGSIAVKTMVAIRTVLVGRTRLNESIALISVSEPPYMFSAVTETRPSIEKIRTAPPNPLKRVSPAFSRDAMVSKFLPAQVASAAPRHIGQMAPSADPQYVHRNVLRIPTVGGR